MRLRQRVLLIFLGLGVLPIVAVGWLAHQRTLKAIEDLVASQAGASAARVAAAIDERYRPRRAELLYFAENAETLRLLREGGGQAEDAPDPRDHLRDAWGTLGGSFRGMQVVAAGGSALFQSGGPVSPGGPSRPSSPGSVHLTLTEDVLDPSTGRTLGQVRLTLDPSVVFPSLAGNLGFGQQGEVLVLDRESGLIVGHPERQAVGQALGSLFPQLESLQPPLSDRPAPPSAGGQSPPSAGELTPPSSIPSLQAEPENPLRLESGDSLRMAAFAEVPRSPWLVVSLASVDEFATGITRTGEATLGFVVLIAALALMVGMFATKRAMHSLESLTLAAGRISDGDLNPELPDPAPDEVGTLTRAFQTMVGEVEGMLRRVERNRQLAAVGEFASQVAHEIRNPLTAIRVNLQALRRDLRGSPLAEDHGRPLDITIGEVDRLDRVTRGVLTLAHPPNLDSGPVDLHAEIRTAVAAQQPDLDRSGVTVEPRLDAPASTVEGDGPALRGAILNLIRNAAEAMPEGGVVDLRTEVISIRGGPFVRLHVVDEGEGIPDAVRDRLFEPFAGTKEDGSGLGLAISLRTVETHGGELNVREEEAVPGGAKGAHFVMDLPLLAGPGPGGENQPGSRGREATP